MDNVPDTQAQVAPIAEQQSNERVFKQSELNEIVGKVRQESAEKAVENFKRQQAQSSNFAPSAYDSSPSSRGISEDDIRRLTGEELDKKREQWTREQQEKLNAEEAQRIVDTYRRKIEPGREKYQDFENVTNSLDMRYYPNVVQLLAEQVDNSHDVLYELARNRSKLMQLESMCAHNPADGIYEIKRLADSIKANEQTAQTRHPKAPLTQQRPSNTGTDSAPLSVRDYKKMYRG